ncbi:MAG: hypothetical protein AB7E76_09395 [Deferribacterales bacterium]
MKQIFQEKLELVLNKKILNQIRILRKYKDVKYHHLTLKGLVETLAKIISYSYQNKHLPSSGHVDEYHIFSTDLAILKRNKLSKYFVFFRRGDNSTYHRNNSKGSERNGYPHWYTYSDLINKAVDTAMWLTVRQIKYLDKFQYYEDAHKEKIRTVLRTDADQKADSFIKVRKDIFLKLYKEFKKGLCDDFLILLNNCIGSDSEYVYAENEVLKSSLEGHGREYTTIGMFSKNFRSVILKGYTEIDINSAIQSVLVNLYYMNTIIQSKRNSLSYLKEDFPAHYSLITNKSMFRWKYTNVFRCSEPLAKEIITSISYSPKSRIIYKYCKQRNNLFSPKSILQCKKLVEPYIAETNKLRERVLEKFYHQNSDSNEFFKIGNIRVKDFKDMIDAEIQEHNQTLKGKGRGKSLDDRRIYRIYELVERQVRLKMIEFIESKGIADFYQIHDCVIFDGKIDVNELRQFIYQELNMIIGFSEKTY